MGETEMTWGVDVWCVKVARKMEREWVFSTYWWLWWNSENATEIQYDPGPKAVWS